MTASVSDHYQSIRTELAEQSYQHTLFTLQLAGRFVKRVAASIGQGLMRWAVAYEGIAQERIMRELALTHPELVAQIRAGRAATERATRPSPVAGLWE